MSHTEDWDFEGESSVMESIKHALRNFIAYMRGQSSLKQSFGALFLSIITGVAAGLFLGKLEETLLFLPGLIVLIPGAMSMRGNIFGALGSRLGTALHMGRIDKLALRSRYIRNNIYSSVTLTIFTSIALAFIARTLLLIFGIRSAGVLHLMLISFIGGLLSALMLIVITFGIAFAAHRKRWDPDNVTSPLITALGDFFTIPSLALAAGFVLGLANFYIMAMSVLVAAVAIINIVFVFVAESSHEALVFREGSYRTIVVQSVLIMLLAGTLSALAGLLLESKLGALLAVPIIITLVPAFLEEAGNIGNILSSRLGTQLNEGRMAARFKMEEEVKREIVNSYILSLMVFPAVGVFVYVFGGLIGIGGIPLAKLLFATLVAGLMLTTIVVAASLFVSVVASRYRINPDNVTIPLISGIADVLGVFVLMGVMISFGVLAV